MIAIFGSISYFYNAFVRLKDILEDVCINNDAVYIVYHSFDPHLSGDPSKEPISRGCPISKALQDETLLAFEMNGKECTLDKIDGNQPEKSEVS